MHRLTSHTEDLIYDAYDRFRYLGDDTLCRRWVAAQDALQRYYRIDQVLVVSTAWGVDIDNLPAAALRQIAAREGWASFRNSPATRRQLNELIARRFAAFLFAVLSAAEAERARS